MNCRELIDFLGDYLDDALPVVQLREFEEHMRCCPYCRDYLASY